MDEKRNPKLDVTRKASQMSKTEELDKLFVRWEEEFPKYKGKFKKDGIVYESTFEKQKLKLLFIAKEPNDPDQNKDDFREWWSKEVKYSFSHRICEWAYGFQNNFPPLDGLSDDARLEVMQSIAFMNIKKSGGGATANDVLIKKTLVEESHLLIEEINIIEPTIIIGGIGNANYWKELFPDIQLIDSGFDIEVARVNNYKLINYYHPSYRVPRAMSYALLGMVSNSRIFKEL